MPGSCFAIPVSGILFPMANTFDVVVIGGLNTDFVITGETLPRAGQTTTGRQFFSGPGGKGANQAVAAARLGARTAFIGKAGNDDRAEPLLQSLRSEGIDLSAISRDSKTPTGAALIHVDSSGEKQISAYLGANFKLTSKDIDRARPLLENCKVLLMQFEVPLPSLERAARLAKARGAKIILDPAPPANPSDRFLRLIDVIRPNSDEAEALTGVKIKDRKSARQAALKLFRKGIKVVCCQAGEEGDLLITPDEEHFFPRLKVRSVDATGAGDAFAGALAVGFAKGLPLDEIGATANAAAALATTKIGAQAGLPGWKQMMRARQKRQGAAFAQPAPLQGRQSR
jgi:ribokinase